MFYIATLDAYYIVVHLVEYAAPAPGGPGARPVACRHGGTHVVEIVDGYLPTTVVLIFALGLYELFISEIDPAAGVETSSKVLVIDGLDDRKARLGKVVLLI